jgi:uncharacterized protein YrrD
MTTEAQKKASAKYDNANTKQIKMKLNTTTDADILAKLEEVGNIQGYIKQLIRADISK